MGLFDLVTAPRIAELGKIKVGKLDEKVRQSKSGGTWRAPQKIDHFLITGTERTADGDLRPDVKLMTLLAEKYADDDGRLRRLPIMVCSNDIEDIIQARFVWYAGRRVAARSDGKTVVWFGNPKTMKFYPPGQEVEEAWKEDYLDLAAPNGTKLFKLHSVFNCMIASSGARWGGVYKLRTTSRISANQLVGSLLHIHQLTGGVLRGLPMQLVVRPMKVEPDGKPTTVYVVHCELMGADLLEIRAEALKLSASEAANSRQLRAAQIEYRRLLQAPGENESLEESSAIAAEFHPESVADDATSEPAPTDEAHEPEPNDGMIGMDDLLQGAGDAAEPAEATPANGKGKK